MDRGIWWAAVHEVAKIQTQLSDSRAAAALAICALSGSSSQVSVVRGFHVVFMLHAASATTQVTAVFMSPAGNTWDS